MIRSMTCAAAIAFAAGAPLAIAAAQVPSEFEARAIITLADGAMLATGYIDGVLGARQPDLLSVLTAGNRVDTAVSNSVATWPNVLALTPDQRFAIVTEPFSQPAAEAQAFADIERGHRVTVVDLNDPASPTVVQEIDAPGTPAAVDVHPDGRLVAVTLPFEGSIALYPFQDGRLGEPTVQTLGIEDLANTFVPEFKWRPDGDFAAVTLGGADRVVFYRFDGERLVPWGEPLQTAPLPGKGEWTPDGRHFIVTTITATGDMAQLGYGQNASLFAVFAFDDTPTPDSPPRRANDRTAAYESPAIQHARVAHIPGGMGYVENFAITPDGRHLVGLNMAASWLPGDHPGRTRYSELTLFGFEGETGRLTPLGTTRLDGVILPQGIAFDAEGRHLVVSSFQHDDREGGSLSFWRLDALENAPSIVPLGAVVPMPRGVHFIAIVE